MSATSSTTSTGARDRARRIVAVLDAAVGRDSFIVGEQVRRLEARVGELTGRDAVAVSGPAVGLLLLVRTAFPGAEPVLAAPAGAAARAVVDAERRLVQRASRLWAGDPPAGPVTVAELGDAGTDPAAGAAPVVRLVDLRDLAAGGPPGWAAARIAAADALVLHAPADWAAAAGDVGVVACAPDTARTLRVLRNHGRSGLGTYLHAAVGFNNRADEVQAALLLDLLGAGGDR